MRACEQELERRKETNKQTTGNGNGNGKRRLISGILGMEFVVWLVCVCVHGCMV